MRKPTWTLAALTLIALFFLTSLILPLIRGESPVDLGLDLAGGVVVTYRPDFSSRTPAYRDVPEAELLTLSKEILENRLYRASNTTPDVVVRGDQRIVVSVPGDQDSRRILDLVGETYRLTLRLVLDEHAAAVDGKKLFPYRGRHLELAPATLSGDMLDERSIRVQAGDSGTFDLAPKVAFRFRPPHDAAFAELTGGHVGEWLAILLDDRIEWAGVIESAITDVGVLSGGYSLQQATDVAVMLRSGSLPMSLEIESLSAVGPGLGQEIRELGWKAMLLAVAALAVLVAVAYWHRGWLLIAGLTSLACLLLMIAGMVAAFGLTLDLAGIAGLILSVGMGMDAFILVFESLEASHSRDRAASHFDAIVRAAYSWAGEGRTLFHANATTLVVVLLLLSTERLKSFAVMMWVGISASVLTIFLTREVLRRTRGRLPGLGFEALAWLRRLRPRIFRFRKLYLAAMAIGLAAVLATAGPSLDLGADFEPGTQLIVAGGEDGVRDSLAEIEKRYPELEVRSQRLESSTAEIDTRYLVTLGVPFGDADRILDAFAEISVEVESVASIDGRLSSRRMLSSLSVLGLSFVFLALYFRAQSSIDRFLSPRRSVARAAAGAGMLVFSGILLAVVLDLAVTWAVITVLGIPINLPVIAALLTIIGYSVNDSVVLWSHVQARWSGLGRERRPGSAIEVVTTSVDRILSRAVLTTASTLVPAVTILAVGLTPLRDFAWVMLAGTVAGTLSSMFVVGWFAVGALEREAGAQTSEGRSKGRRNGRHGKAPASASRSGGCQASLSSDAIARDGGQ